MEQTFNIKIAEKLCSIESAILYQNICMMVEKNKVNNHNLINGVYWVSYSHEAWQKLFPYMRKYTIKSALEKLKKENFIVVEVGINPKNRFDKSAYYRQTGKYPFKTPASVNDTKEGGVE